jgi:general secretion pathway protein D
MQRRRWARPGAWVCAAVVLGVVLGVVGCAQQRIRDGADTALRDGQYETAVRQLEAGVKDHPDSTLLRSGLVQARAEAMARLVATAAAERAAGRLAEAQATLQRALSIEATNRRVLDLLAELDTERIQRAALAEALELAEKKRPQAALRVIEQALKGNPRQGELLALQRRLEMEQRQVQVQAARTGLAENRPISLDFRDASLRTVLDLVSRNSGVNFILDKDIRAETRVTVFLRGARVEDAIELITSTNQLAKKVIDDKTILIYPNTPEKQREHQEQIVKVFYLASADAKGAAGFLRSMLRVREPFVDERTNMVAIRESQETIQLAERLITLYDTSDPEVMLEVEVLEVKTSRLTELGVKFPDSFSLTPLGPGGSGGLTLANAADINSGRIALSVSGLLFNLKREVGDFNTLAAPKIRARNKEKAKILIGDKLPVVTTTTSGNGGFAGESVNYVDVGLKLDVEPTVYADDEVAIRVALEVSTLVREIRTGSGTLAYQIGTRNAATLLRLRDGETQLLAGLISRDERTSSARVPGAGDLPVLGRLFSNQRDDTQRTELVLAITPRIVRNIRRPDANETEVWVGTDALTRLRPAGGVRVADAGDSVALQMSTALAGAPAAGTPAVTAAGGAAAPPLAATAAAPSAMPGAALPGAAAGVLPGAVPPPPAATSFKWVAPASVPAGQVFTVQLQVSSMAPLRGAPLQLRFSKDKLALLEIEEGEHLKQGAAQTSFTKTVEASEGRARAGVLRNQATGATGEGVVVKLTLKALAAGPAEVALVEAEPIGATQSLPKPALPVVARIEVK